jgi:hypothetical protein
VTLKEFKSSLTGGQPPEGSAVLLVALWYDAKGDWQKAHGLAQEVNSSDGSWVHAYLHRKEGDLSNAGYWYRHARKSLPDNSLEMEWDEIVAALLKA